MTLKRLIGSSLQPEDEKKMRDHLTRSMDSNQTHRDVFGLNPILFGLQTAKIVVEEIGLKRDAVLAILLHPSIADGFTSVDDVRRDFGESVARIHSGH